MKPTIGRTPGLPVEAYTTREWFEREQQELFSQVWQFAAVEDDVKKPGDLVTVSAGVHPLVVVRGDDYRLRAFHNICRHRGTQLLRTSGRSSTSIVCPYHNWTYSINGDLVSVPQPERFGTCDFSQVALHGAAVDTWNGLVFVHPDPRPAQSLSDWLDGFPEHFGPHRPAELVEVAPDEHEWHANWKIIVENYVDGYHLFHLHAKTLDMYDHARAETAFHGRHFAFFEPPTPALRKWLARNQRSTLREIGRDQWGAYVHMLFPCTGLTGLEMSFSIFQVIPLAPARSRIVIRNFTSARNASAARWSRIGEAIHRRLRPSNGDPLASGDFMEEDRLACEQQQAAMRSPYFGVGATATGYEDGVLGFQRNVADYVLDVR